MSNFNSIVTVEKIQVDGYIANISIKIVSPTESDIQRAYNFYTQNLITGETNKTNDNFYWIDRYSSNDTIGGFNVNIRRNKTITLRVNLRDGTISDGRLMARVVIHMKEISLNTIEDENVWTSDELIITSEQISFPELECVSMFAKEGETANTLVCKIKAIHKNPDAKKQFSTYLSMFAKFHDISGMFEEETVAVSDASNDIYAFESEEAYDIDRARVTIMLKWGNGTLAFAKSFTRDTVRTYTAFVAEEYVVRKAMSAWYAYDEDKGTKIVNFFIKKH